MKNKLFLFLFFLSFVVFSQKIYQKKYFDNGNLKEEGWILNSNKNGYWYSYFQNGKIKDEGYFNNNLKTGFWKDYNTKGIKISEGDYKTNQEAELTAILKCIDLINS